jgi:hypothetical protein
MILKTDCLDGARTKNQEAVEQCKRYFTDSRLIVRDSAPSTYRLAMQVYDWFSILKRCFLSILVAISAACVISCVPTDLRAEENYLYYFDQQRLSECQRDYDDNGCADSDDSSICAELRGCLGDRQAALKQATVRRLLWGVVNSFFLALTPKAAWVIGVTSGIALFACLFM